MSDNEERENNKVNELVHRLNELIENDDMKMYQEDLYE